ncbi:MFS transporter [Duganella sp. FT80W]|uniref:MFS transporter n=2 Tax=Duganella guangzhouensis TaxID=2666084 RepID=A0A6I2KXL6_9BURK|nr:MFS transporter [Duganella guangzhouensis]
MSRARVALFACASGLSVANVYYAQPLLDALAAEFAISPGAVGGMVTATQVGSALALLSLVPLGDMLPRRRLMLAQLTALAVALACVCMARSAGMVMLGMTLVGMLGTAMTQGLIAYAASSAAAHERGRVVGAAQGGVVAGLLLARVFAGAVADLAGWRAVYGVSCVLMLLLAATLRRALPVLPVLPVLPGGAGTLSAGLRRYLLLLGSMFTLLRRNRMLQVRGVIALLMFAVFSAFWSTLVFLLSAPPYQYTHTTIGAFGLVGLAGAMAAAGAGRRADQGRAQQTSAAALVLMLLSWAPLALAPSSLIALIAGVLLLDLGVQALHVTNQSLILHHASATHGRLIGAYMMFYAAGSGAGALTATTIYAAAGWHGVCVLGAALSLLALFFWWITKWPVRIAKVAGPI